ncbi:MAG: IS110 family transposase [Zoogloeaceae bacterium]|jgi:transposase|nr:IS110 family transposase [Zoogloeaceae bacterium]
MSQAYFIGLDIAKNVFQAFSADEKGKAIANKKMGRSAVKEYFVRLAPCTIGIEACGTSHYWARTLTAMGHVVRLISPERVKAFLGSHNKTDAADAKAICEALMHPGTRFIASKTEEQQDTDHLLSRRERLVHTMTQIVNQTRSFLAERGIVIPQGRHKFMQEFPKIISAQWDGFSGDFQAVLTENYAEYQEVADKIAGLDTLISVRVKSSESCQRLMKINGIGPLTALALVAHVGSAEQFHNGRQMSAYLGLTPREHSSGGKQRMLGISKRGNVRLRTLLILCARAVIHGIGRRRRGADGEPLGMTALDTWVLSLVARKGVFKAAVALANKLVRMAWVVLAKGETYDISKACKAWAA